MSSISYYDVYGRVLLGKELLDTTRDLITKGDTLIDKLREKGEHRAIASVQSFQVRLLNFIKKYEAFLGTKFEKDNLIMQFNYEVRRMKIALSVGGFITKEF